MTYFITVPVLFLPYHLLYHTYLYLHYHIITKMYFINLSRHHIIVIIIIIIIIYT